MATGKRASRKMQSSSQDLAHKYLYCVMRAKRPRTFDVPGVAGPDYPIHTIHFRELAVAVSDSPVVSYDSTRQNMAAHMRVLEEVMKEQTILPLKFNSVAATAGAVCDALLKPGYRELDTRLDTVAGRVEMGVKAFWRENVLYREIVAENEEIRRLRDRIAAPSPDTTYKDRIKLGELVDRALLAKRERESERMLSRLRPYVEAIRIHEPAAGRLALNAALLVNKSEQPALEESLNRLDREEGRRITLKCAGPAPVYNFVQLTLGRLDPPGTNNLTLEDDPWRD